MIKKIFAWAFVLVVAYVVIYTYAHPEYVHYYKDEAEVERAVSYDPSIPVGKENILMKEKNPFVFYALKFQGWFLAAMVAFLVIDYKGTGKLFKKLGAFFGKTIEKLDNEDKIDKKHK